jgi:7-cyano-7-deazaguanine synthase
MKSSAITENESWREHPVAVLTSGGLDSAILVGDLARTCPRVHPIYVKFGLIWEAVEQRYLETYLSALAASNVAPLLCLDMPIKVVYGEHWSITGSDIPGYHTSDDAVFLPGRNLLLFAEAAVWCHLNQVPAVALASLSSNLFPDATDAFFESAARTVDLALNRRIAILRPYSRLSKRDVMLIGRDFPLEHTYSCIRPVAGVHCGTCNKCAERQKAFVAAGLSDPTRYAGDGSLA